MKAAIVITSINEPTDAVRAFAGLAEFSLVVVGDRKTPSGWRCGNAVFLGVDAAPTNAFALSSVLPYNHYCRKMIGYLHAIKLGAEAIVDTDDDNIPKPAWAFPLFDGLFDHVDEGMGFVNVYRHFTKQQVWPRGLPLRLITAQGEFESSVRKRHACVGVWQGLADEDPDVDAVYRLTCDQPVYFAKREPLVLGKGTISPFNSQNTMFRKELFALLYLPALVTFRFTDILRGLVCLPIMWLYGYTLGFTQATVVQRRNPHDYFEDFLSEVPMYRDGEKVVDIVQGAIVADRSVEENLRLAYTALHKNGIVPEGELKILDYWLRDLAEICGISVAP